MSKLDIPVTPPKVSDGKRYVTVPDKDLFDMPHPPIQINNEKYGPGTHYLDKETADTVEDRLKAYSTANVRLLQPKKDANAEALMQRGFNQSNGASGQMTTNF